MLKDIGIFCFKLCKVDVNLEKSFLHCRLYVQMYIAYGGQTFSEDHSFNKHCFFLSTYWRGITVTTETKKLRYDCLIM